MIARFDRPARVSATDVTTFAVLAVILLMEVSSLFAPDKGIPSTSFMASPTPAAEAQCQNSAPKLRAS